MPFPVQHPNFAAPHRLAEPLDVVDGDARVAAAVVDDDGAGDVDVTEADCVASFETDEEVDGWVGACGGEFPDGVGETEVVGDLAFLVGHCIDGRCEDCRLAVSCSLRGVHAVHVFRCVGRLQVRSTIVSSIRMLAIDLMSNILLIQRRGDISTRSAFSPVCVCSSL